MTSFFSQDKGIEQERIGLIIKGYGESEGTLIK